MKKGNIISSNYDILRSPFSQNIPVKNMKFIYVLIYRYIDL